MRVGDTARHPLKFECGGHSLRHGDADQHPDQRTASQISLRRRNQGVIGPL